MNNRQKKGVSDVLATVLLIAITISVAAIVWVVVRNLVQGDIQSSNACFGIFDKVEINSQYTCYNNTAGTDELWFSISVGDIEKIEDILVGISGSGTSSSFKIIGDNPANLSYFNRTKPSVLSIPGKNSGQAYIYKLPGNFTEKPDSIQIALIIDGEMCGDLAPITEFDSCSNLV